ncbi:duodenase-1-like isoform X4 [Dicentrarchus labrax]|uniref:duodenase-1-like isoform X3 n=1 Tax=Dicentrarchus labrax TaxID=13489 RepID=UPI0021F55F01|nr:duodenase-1-like isoform X3 [Dicentrarchus labrax]XP_051231510.1 duodenase-1-like isoform X4 [Dicentrarchus labrax]
MYALHKLLLFHVLICLGQNGNGGKIINGTKAPEDSMQYMVSLQNNGGHDCGGFLIREDFVLTAAHCHIDAHTHVVLGTHNLKRGGKIRYIEKKYKHHSYENVGRGNDIMLLKLSEKVQLDNSVQTIPIPSSEINIRENESCRVAGWGATITGGSVVDDLRLVDVSIISQNVCNETWGGLPRNIICAGGYGTTKGFCQGDSGGPLVCNGVAVGIVSFNYKKNCTYPLKPNVYTDVSKYLFWIDNILNE